MYSIFDSAELNHCMRNVNSHYKLWTELAWLRDFGMLKSDFVWLTDNRSNEVYRVSMYDIHEWVAVK